MYPTAEEIEANREGFLSMGQSGLRLHCYNAIRAEKLGKPLTKVDRLILLRSSPHVHTEIQFSSRYDGVSFSATMQDGSNCCRFKQITYTHPERWDTLFIPCTEAQEDKGMARAKEIEGCKYDLIGLLSFATELNIIKPHPDKYWCNEVCGEVIIAVKDYDFKPDSLTPTGLFFEIFHRI